MLKNLLKKLGGDFILSVSAVVIFNGVIQFLLNPYLTGQLGAEKFGTVIYLISIISVVGAFGTAANYSRMVVTAKRGCTNGDYNRYFLIVAGIVLAVSAVGLVALKSFEPLYFIGYAALMFMTILRYYGDVEYRLSCNFKGYFVFYLLIAVGYITGILLFRFTGSWVITMLIGEALAILFVGIKGKIFKPPFLKKSVNYRENTRSVWTLVPANLVQTVILNADRILVMFFVGSYDVTVFYVATLVGKIVALVTVPLEGLVISYLNKYEDKISYKLFLGFAGGAAALAALMICASTVASHILIPFMYPEDVYQAASQYFIVANAGQVLFFISTVLITFVLKISGENSQLVMNLIYLAVFAAVVIPCIAIWGLWGLAWSVAGVNLMRVVLISVYGLIKLKKRPAVNN